MLEAKIWCALHDLAHNEHMAGLALTFSPSQLMCAHDSIAPKKAFLVPHVADGQRDIIQLNEANKAQLLKSGCAFAVISGLDCMYCLKGPKFVTKSVVEECANKANGGQPVTSNVPLCVPYFWCQQVETGANMEEVCLKVLNAYICAHSLMHTHWHAITETMIKRERD